ncbi:helix-turn-helix domain-containing protein [Bacillus capparidis]|uniref:DNA-binding transcriptional ArsR family regulator n=1 Tax=Bacillus capparidis TaxID=1840411 RepID=A0ABS4CT74_9BACI|nr:helix-turn-helix domain-containing protein [Bacillus capparidis]MBP1080777.1 DNA-binding transcriptional ArsR family regulator [Bacillus capparidis]MED1094629.1 helix-turn-helix domain-containing protein [Bacillus capparidis]
MKESKVGFIKFNSSLMNDYRLKMGETLVYGALVSFRHMSIQSNTKDEQGQVYAYPPISSIANITGQSERSVKSHIQVLEEKRLMTVKRSYKEGGKEKNVNHYYLNTEVLKVYFTADTNMTTSVKIAKPKTTDSKEKPKETKQKVFIADAEIEKWFTHYQGEHNNNSAKKLNELAEKYGSETVVKTIHNAMNGVNIDTLPQGTTGLILSRLNEKNLEDAKLQLRNEKERQERFMNEQITPFFDYKAELRRKQKKENNTFSNDMKALLGEVL